MNVKGNITRARRRVPESRLSRVPRRGRRPSISTIIMVSLLVVGSSIVVYPTFADWWNNYHQYRAISDYVTAVERVDKKDIERMLSEAEAYNQRLLSNTNRFTMTDEERAEYESILNITQTGIIGYIQVPQLGINYPIYHGISEEILQRAIGHIEGTSLPVGGPSTHAAVSGHRGLPSAKLFSDLDKMTEGDLFTITVLNKTLAYTVDQIRIVEPTDMSDLNIIDGEDYVTLVTCTPYGVNTHRLLVRGIRTDDIAGIVAIPAEAVQIPNYITVPAVGIPMLFTYLVGSLIYYRFSDHGYDRQKVMAELEDMKGGEGHEGGET